MSDGKTVDKKELAYALRVSVSTVNNMMRDYNRLYDAGYIDEALSCCVPPIYLSNGKLVRFFSSDVDEFIEKSNEFSIK